MNVTSWFKDSFGWAEPTGAVSQSGDPAYGSITTALGRWESRMELVQRAADGAQIMSSDTIYTAAAVSLQARIWRPGFDTAKPGLARNPIRVDSVEDQFSRVVFYKVRL